MRKDGDSREYPFGQLPYEPARLVGDYERGRGPRDTASSSPSFTRESIFWASPGSMVRNEPWGVSWTDFTIASSISWLREMACIVGSFDMWLLVICLDRPILTYSVRRSVSFVIGA